ncbi:MAG: nucleoside triphosphate pyrophosphohydrolase, partial [Pygmaiobacter sp.]
FSAVNVARMLHLDPELALTRSTDKFAARVKAVEAMTAHQSDSFATLSPEQLDLFWQRTKKCFP